jgi:type I restriction enzyme S subunit
MFQKLPLETVTINHDTKRVPVKEAERKIGPYPYYGASGIVDYVDGFLFDGEYLLVAEDGENLRSRNTPIAFRATGKFWVNNHAHIIQGNEKALTRYLEYAINLADIASYLTGSIMPKLTQGNLNRLPVVIPPMAVQEKIVKIVGEIDDKVKLNIQINENLESMARAIFKEWFIDFNPVKSNDEGKKPFGMDDETATLFPNSFEDSELGPIPKGWIISNLENLVGIKHGFAFKGEYFSDEPTADILLTPGNFKIGGGFKSDKLKYYNGPLVEGYILNEDDVILTMTDLSKEGDTLGYPALIPKRTNLNFLHNQRVGLLLLKDSEIKLWIYNLFQTGAYRSWILGSCTGSTVKHTSPSRILGFKTALPPDKLMQLFHTKVLPFYEQIKANELENLYLVSVRDLLLPKLISGEIDLRDIKL